jgi:hypothetical protein
LDRANEAVEKAAQVLQTFQSGQAQQPEQNSQLGRSWGGQSAFFSGGRAGTNVSSAIRKAAEAVRDAKGDEAKSAAQKNSQNY